MRRLDVRRRRGHDHVTKMDEEKKIISDYPGYAISKDGTVWSRWSRGGRSRVLTDKWYVKESDADEKDHLHVQLFSEDKPPKRRPVHLLVLEAFVGPRPDGMEGCHKDGNPRNNAMDNLRWDTAIGNWEDRKKHGKGCEGSKNTSAKLTPGDVTEINKGYESGIKIRELSKRFGVTYQQIWKIVHKKAWKVIV